MTLTIHTITRIAPASRTARDRARAGQGADGLYVECDAAATQSADAVNTIPAVQSRDGTQTPPGRPDVPGSLAAQLIAQNTAAKSDRRLARYFPERVNAAYRQVALSSAPPRQNAQKQV